MTIGVDKTARSATLPRLDSLTGLRAVAAFAVFVGHAMARVEGDPARILSYVTSQGGMGVTFFFILSGFVLTWSHRAGDAALPFYRRRFARIYPAYFVALLAGVVVTYLSKGMHDSLGPLLASAALVQSWVPDSSYYFAINGVNWSLSCEAFFYLIFPLVIPWLFGIRDRNRRFLQVALLAGIIVADSIGAAMEVHTGSWLIGHLPLVRSLEFVLGCTVAIDVMRGQWRRVSFPVAAWATLAIVLLAGLWVTPFTNTLIPTIPFLAMIASAANQDLASTKGFFATRPMVWLGEISFCFYLVHQLVIRCVGILGDSDTWAGAALRIGIALGFSLLAAWALHAWVERPMERLLRGSARSRPPVTAAH